MLTKGQVKEIIAQMDAGGVPDSVQFGVKMLNGDKVELQNSFSIVGKNSEFSIDASDHWAEQVAEAEGVYLKQV